MIYLPRTYKKKGVHTGPETAGIQNMPDPDTMPKDEDALMTKILPVYKHGNFNRGVYKGQWTEETLSAEIDAFFEYCNDVQLKPTLPGLRLWLDVSKETMNEWRTKPEKYGVKSDLCRKATEVMEFYLQGNIDKYPTGSIFLLKTTHGHKESVDVNVTSQNASKEDIGNAIANLGLDKPE